MLVQKDYDIYWNGCSFVQGMELNRSKQDCFTNLVSEHFNADWFRNSKIGGSNDRIWRVSMEDALVGRKPKLAVIVWSGINRLEYLNDANLWRQVGFTSFVFDKVKYKTLDISKIYYHPDMTNKQYNGFKNYVLHSRTMKYNLINSINYMISLRHFYNSQGIPHLFYMMSNGQIDPGLKYLDENREEAANIQWSPANRMKLKDYLKEIPELTSEGIYDMTKGKVPYGPKDHPLEEGHQLIADRIIKDIYEKRLDKIFN